LKKHTGVDNLWIAIRGKVYDVSKFLDDHPGGDEVLKDVAGKDATDSYDDVGHSDDAEAMLNTYYVGEFKAAEGAAVAKKEKPKAVAPVPKGGSGGSITAQAAAAFLVVVLVAAAIRIFLV